MGTRKEEGAVGGGAEEMRGGKHRLPRRVARQGWGKELALSLSLPLSSHYLSIYMFAFMFKKSKTQACWTSWLHITRKQTSSRTVLVYNAQICRNIGIYMGSLEEHI